MDALLALSQGVEDMQGILGIILSVLSILTGLIVLIRWLILIPLDRRLDAHAEKTMNSIERRFVDGILKRIEGLEHLTNLRYRQSFLWKRALHDELTEQGVKSPDPTDFEWDPSSREAGC